MNSFALYLSASDKEIGSSGGHAELPVWMHVEMRIDRAFKLGGRVELRSQTQLTSALERRACRGGCPP